MVEPWTTNSLSLDEVFESTVERVYGFLICRCGNETLAEDLVAETYLAASSKFAQGRGNEITSSWLLTVARRRLIDYWRTDSSRSRGLDALGNSLRAKEIVNDQDHVIHLESEDAVSLALASLSQRYRAALVLRYLEDFSVSEVAEALGLTYKATESVLSRARVAFGKAYEEYQ